MATDCEVDLLLDSPVSWDGTEYRLDIAPSYHGNASLANLARLCSDNSERDAKLRSLLIDLCPPRYSTSPPTHLTGSTSSHITQTTPLSGGWCLDGLNSNQKAALEKVLCSQDYALILGRPGTGKTTTISRLVQSLVAMGASVLVTSYTHSAVDNILLKLKEAGVDFLRLGTRHVVHPSLHHYLPSHTHCSSVAELGTLYSSKPVVATTCLGINHALFSRRTFDYCVVDEASQLTVPVSLGPLRCAGVFVLVGDHYQLPPLVRSEEARAGGLGVSLFRLLSVRHPSSMVTLDDQYRMNSEIMLLSNTLFYDHQLKCGDVGVASARLLLPLPAVLQTLSQEWLRQAVNPDQPVIFLNTDKMEGKGEDSGFGERMWNKCEVEIVTKLISAFFQCGVHGDQVGVVTPYRYQQRKIKEAIADLMSNRKNATTTDSGAVEVNTVDRYQGRDKTCIIVSFVRSNSQRNVGSILCDWRRINVALTRARHKLVLLGSLSTLSSSPSLNCLLELLAEKCWITHITC